MLMRVLVRANLSLALSLVGAASALCQAGSPAGPVPVDRLRARRAALLDRLGEGIAVLSSAQLKSIEGDYPQDSDYRENNDFFYLTGLEAPGALLVLVARKSGPDQTFLYLPARDTLHEKWTGPRLGPGAEATRLTGVADVRPADRAPAEIPDQILGSRSPARAGALYLSKRSGGGSDLLQDLTFRWGRQSGSRTRDLDEQIGRLRLVKDGDELSRLRHAIGIT